MSDRAFHQAAAKAVRCTAVLALAQLLAVLASAEPCHAEDSESEPYARVIVEHAAVRAGPGVGFRRVYLAERGEVFPVLSRATQGYWFRIELPDSTQGWVAGDAVHPHELTSEGAPRERWLPWLFAPPPLAVGRGEVAITGGVLGGGGMFAVRPAVLLDPAFGIELNALAGVSSAGRLWMVTVGPVVNMLPRSPIVPFATIQGGVTSSRPNADSFLLESGTIASLNAGFGLRVGFHYRITLRLEARTHVFFEPDHIGSQEEFSAGLTVVF
jgi:hypothetical protein